MAFNKSAFKASSLNTAKQNAAENKTVYADSSNTTRKWYKCINGIKPFVKPAEPCKMVVNILPFQRKDGTYDWVYNAYVHQIPNPTGFGTNDFICTRNDPCDVRKAAIDNAAKEAGLAKAEWDDVKAYVPKQRTLYLMNPVGTDDVLIFECNTKGSSTVKSFVEKLNGQAVACAGTEDIVDYASPDSGKSVVLVWGENTFNGHKFREITGIAFTERKEEISDAVWEKIPDYIEQLVNITDHDEADMQKLIDGEEVPAQEREEKKQEDFEKSCEDALASFKANGVKTADFNDTIDFSQDPYTVKKEEPKPSAQEAFCPNGFDPASDFGAKRQCMHCPKAEECEKKFG